MGKQTKVWLEIAVALLVIGCLILGGVMTIMEWDFSRLSTTEYEINEYTLEQSFQNIQITTDTADIIFVPTQQSDVMVTCHEHSNIHHTVTVNGDTLTIQTKDTRKWYEYIGINLGSQSITVALPHAQYDTLWLRSTTGDIKIPGGYSFVNAQIITSTGDIDVANITADALTVAVTTGKASITDLKCKNFNSFGSTGDLLLKNVVATENFAIERDTGDVQFDGCDAGDISVETDTGSVTGTLLSEKIFITESDTGRVNVPKTFTGGKCKISTDTGNIIIKVQ